MLEGQERHLSAGRDWTPVSRPVVLQNNTRMLYGDAKARPGTSAAADRLIRRQIDQTKAGAAMRRPFYILGSDPWKPRRLRVLNCHIVQVEYGSFSKRTSPSTAPGAAEVTGFMTNDSAASQYLVADPATSKADGGLTVVLLGFSPQSAAS